MRVLGRVRTYTRNKNLVIEASEKPRVGEKVFDSRMMHIGYIYDIIGPVSSPYVVVKLSRTDIRPEALVGKVVYWRGSEKRRGGRPRRR